MGHKPDDECVPAQWNHPRCPYIIPRIARPCPSPNRDGWLEIPRLSDVGYAPRKSAGGRLAQLAVTHDTRQCVCAPRDARPRLRTSLGRGAARHCGGSDGAADGAGVVVFDTHRRTTWFLDTTWRFRGRCQPRERALL